jgi:hypothetical protein
MKMHLHDNKKAPSQDFITFLNGIFKNRESNGKFTKIEMNLCSPFISLISGHRNSSTSRLVARLG